MFNVPDPHPIAFSSVKAIHTGLAVLLSVFALS